MRFFPALFLCFFLLVSCSKEPATPNTSDYFLGTWQLRANPTIPNSGTSVTFEKTGKATFHLAYATDPANGNAIRNWSYNDETKELTFGSPMETYRLVEKSTNQFTVITLNTNSGLIFTKN
jgi:hypothetical protein